MAAEYPPPTLWFRYNSTYVHGHISDSGIVRTIFILNFVTPLISKNGWGEGGTTQISVGGGTAIGSGLLKPSIYNNSKGL